MTGNEKMRIHSNLCETTRHIIGRTTVPASKLRNIKGEFAEVHIDNVSYEAILWGKSFKLTGNYITI